MGTKLKFKKDNVENVVTRPPCDEENNEAPDEIRIVKNELNDSFEPDMNELKLKSRRKKKPCQLQNHRNLVNSLNSSRSPKFSPKNIHVRFDENGDPVLNLRPQIYGDFKPVVNDLLSKQIINDDVDNSVDGEDPFTLVKSTHKRKKRLQKVDSSNGSENEVIGTKVSKNCSPLSQSVSDAQNRDAQNNVTSICIKKYWAQRYRLFSRYDEGILMDEESW